VALLGGPGASRDQTLWVRALGSVFKIATDRG
jgi:hypothetical protein